MDRRREDDILGLLAASCLAIALVFAKISAEVIEGEHAGIDQAVRQFALAHQYGAVIALFRGVSVIASKEILVPLSVVIGWLLFRRDKLVVILLLLFGLVTAEFVDMLKLAFRIDRPLAEMRGSRSFSFPSGHVSGAAAIATLFSYVAWRQQTAQLLVLAASALFVGLVAVSRVYLDRHWTTDVIGGGLIGIALGASCCALFELIERRRRPRER